MMRFFAACLGVAVLSIVAVVLLGHFIWDPPSTVADGPKNVVRDPGPAPAPGPNVREVPSENDSKPATVIKDDKPVTYTEVASAATGPQPMIIQEGRVLAIERQDVPSERDGKMLFLGTDVQPGEKVPANKLISYEVSILVRVLNSFDGVPLKDQVRDPQNPKAFYRYIRPEDDLAPRTTAMVRKKLFFRKLDIGDRVKKDQLLGVINPALALADLGVKQAKIEAADADVLTSAAMKEESKRRLDQMSWLRTKINKAASDDEYGAAKATAEKYVQEEISKRASVRQGQQELSGALTTFEMHKIRASIDGVIKSVSKNAGEAVKNNDSILQIQNPKLLRVEAQLDIQDALPLRDRLEKARSKREEATRLRGLAEERKEKSSEAERLEAEADQLVRVHIEASRVTPPLTALPGHRQEVTCVAVTSDPQPRIVSGSEDHTVRVWERIPGSDRWQERVSLNHHAIIRALACTAPKATKNLLLTGTNTGRGRIFDLENLKAGELALQYRHSGSINAVAFSPNGEVCATAGEDRAIYLWNTVDGKLLHKVSAAHRNGITSLSFTAKGQVVSAGRDKQLILWNVVKADDGSQTLEKKSDDFDPRSGEVAQLGVDPTGEHVLFDNGRELRSLSLATKKIDGTLKNPSTTNTFSTMALYSLDGSMVLTNGNAPGRLQLWRTPTMKSRPAELRQYVWTSGNVTCGAFSPDGKLVVTGTQDNRVLVWQMPDKVEAETPTIPGQLSYVEEFLDTSLRRVTVRATLENPDWIIPGSGASIIVPPLPSSSR